MSAIPRDDLSAAHQHPDRFGPRGRGTTEWVSRVALAGIVAPFGFFGVMTALGQVTPDYDWVARYGSELSLGSLGWIMIVNFVALGVVELAVAAALGRTIGNRVTGWVATAGVGLLGAAFIVAGVCVTDPAKLVTGAKTWHGFVHALMAAVIFFVATPIASAAMAIRMRRQRGFAAYCDLTAVGTPILLVATFTSGNLLGLTERIVIAVAFAWLATVAFKLRRGTLVAS
jgi:hypothetical membrane protein